MAASLLGLLLLFLVPAVLIGLNTLRFYSNLNQAPTSAPTATGSTAP